MMRIFQEIITQNLRTIMASNSLEHRVAVLEEEIQRLKQRLGGEQRSKDWRRTVGYFRDDPDFDVIVLEGQKYRARENQAGSP